jgi:hypothetical protein
MMALIARHSGKDAGIQPQGCDALGWHLYFRASSCAV